MWLVKKAMMAGHERIFRGCVSVKSATDVDSFIE